MTSIESAVQDAIRDIATDNSLDVSLAIKTLDECASDMSPLERAQMLEAFDGARFASIEELAKQITEINLGQKKELETPPA